MATYHDAAALGLAARNDAVLPGTNRHIMMPVDATVLPPPPVVQTTGQLWPRANV